MSVEMSIPMSDIESMIKTELDQLPNEIMKEVKSRIELRTPVDTGKARAGWNLDNNIITNDVEYIGYLETGTIHQRPVGMVATTLNEIDSIINQSIDKIA